MYSLSVNRDFPPQKSEIWLAKMPDSAVIVAEVPALAHFWISKLIRTLFYHREKTAGRIKHHSYSLLGQVKS